MLRAWIVGEGRSVWDAMRSRRTRSVSREFGRYDIESVDAGAAVFRVYEVPSSVRTMYVFVGVKALKLS